MNTRLIIPVAVLTALTGIYALRHSGSPSPGAQPEGPGLVDSRPAQTPIAARRQTEPAYKREQADGCTIITQYLPNGDGTVTEAYSCEPGVTEAAHPYENFSNETLASLAYSDAKAAEILSMRLREEDEEVAMSLAIRAAALAGGDAHPILLFSQAYPVPAAIDDAPVKKTYRVKYVLSTVALMLGDDRGGLPTWEASIRRFSDDPDTELALLDERARQIVDEMRQIQLDVTGEATIGG